MALKKRPNDGEVISRCRLAQRRPVQWCGWASLDSPTNFKPRRLNCLVVVVLDYREPAKALIRMIASQRLVAGVVHEDKQAEGVDSQGIGRIHRSPVPRGLSYDQNTGRLPVDLSAENAWHFPAEIRRVLNSLERNPLSLR